VKAGMPGDGCGGLVFLCESRHWVAGSQCLLKTPLTLQLEDIGYELQYREVAQGPDLPDWTSEGIRFWPDV